MSILLGVGVITTVGVLYLGKKGWHAFHRMVGITPGVLVYQSPDQPMALSDMTWQTLALNTDHLQHLPATQLQQIQRIDQKTKLYQAQYQTQLSRQTLTEQQFVLHKLLHTRLPQMLASYHQLHAASAQSMSQTKRNEAGQLLQEALDNIEQRLDALMEQSQNQHLQDLKVMKRYMDSHNDSSDK